MKSTASWFIVAALGAAALLAVVMEHGKAQVVPPKEVRYQTACAAVDANTVEGFVTNQGTGLLQINGLVSFSFSVADTISHPTVQVQGAAMIPPGQTMSVARARLVWSLLPNEFCHFDASGAVR